LELCCPSDLSAEQRKLVKSAAEALGFTTRSFGMGADRQIYIFRPTHQLTPASKHADALGLSIKPSVSPDSSASTDDDLCDAGSEESLDSGRESSPRSPPKSPYSIKNSFIHFQGFDENHAGDPRIVQSMPEGKFAEALAKEVGACAKADATGVREARARPSPLGLEVEVDTCDDSANLEGQMGFPSTPDAHASMEGFHESIVRADTPSWTVHQREPVVSVLPCGMWSPQTCPATSSMVALSEQPLAPPRLTPGASVILCNLAKQPSFNGRRGVISSFDPEFGRYNVQLDTDDIPKFKVKPENVILAAPLNASTGYTPGI
jgi:hypothetical protein